MQNAGVLGAPVILIATALVALFGDLAGRRMARSVNTWVLAGGFLSAAAAILGTPEGSPSPFPGVWELDGIARFAALAALAAGLVYVAASWHRSIVGRSETDYYSLLALSVFGAVVMVGATDLIVLYLGVEITTMPLYALVAFAKDEELGVEGALKYFLTGLLMTLVTVYGMSFLYGVTGTTRLGEIAQQASTFASGRALLFALATLLVSAGLLFKLAAAPFHLWAPDVYEGAPTVVTSVVAFVPKVAGLIALLRIFPIALGPAKAHWQLYFAAIATLSMVLGNVLALVQKNIKRMFAYSAVANAGYLLVGVAVGTPEAIRGSLFFMVAYGAAAVGGLLVLVVTRTQTLEDVAGLARHRLALAIAMAAFLFSLIGLPPFGGFIGKFLVFGAAIQADMAWLAVVGVVNSVVSVGYYIAIARSMFLEPAADTAEWPIDRVAGGAVATLATIVLGLGIAFGPVMGYLSRVP